MRSVQVPSFTEPEVSYEVDVTHPIIPRCRCGSRTPVCKHEALAEDVAPRYDLLEHTEIGVLADMKTRVVILESFETDYEKEEKGFEPGAWQHSLCHDGKNLMCVSWHIDFGYEQRRDVLDVNTWKAHIPPTHHHKEVKHLYRRPNYELSERPVKN
jgi:hypothetical protein